MQGEVGQIGMQSALSLQASNDQDQLLTGLLYDSLFGTAVSGAIKILALSPIAFSGIFNLKAIKFGGKEIVGYAKIGRRVILPGTMLKRVGQIILGTPGILTGKSARALRKNMVDVAVIPGNIFKTVKHKFQAHHIIPLQLGKSKYKNTRSYQILQKIGFNFDDATNGILLKDRLHKGSHNKYTDAIRDALEKIPGNLSIEKTRERVYAIQAGATTGFARGASVSKHGRTSYEKWVDYLNDFTL